MNAPLFHDDTRGAVLDETYRYRLWRILDPTNKRRLLISMLNPSKADVEVDDPTLRRCIGFAKAWGYGRLDICNPFALRATDPAEVRKHPLPVGPQNRLHVIAAAREADMIVVASGAPPSSWGKWNTGPSTMRDHLRTLREHSSGTLHCIGVTDAGWARHPLYLRADLQPMVYSVKDPGT